MEQARYTNFYLRSLSPPEEMYQLLVNTKIEVGTDPKTCTVVVPKACESVSCMLVHGIGLSSSSNNNNNSRGTDEQKLEHVIQLVGVKSSVRVVKAGFCDTDGPGAVVGPNDVVNVVPGDVLVLSGGMRRFLLLGSSRPLTEAEQRLSLHNLNAVIERAEGAEILPPLQSTQVKLSVPTMSSAQDMARTYPNLRFPPLYAYFNGGCDRIVTGSVSLPAPVATEAPAAKEDSTETPTDSSAEPAAKRPKTESIHQQSQSSSPPPLSSPPPPQQRPGRFRAAYERYFLGKIVEAVDADEGLDNFGYYLSPEVKQALVSAAYVFLCRPEYAAHVRGTDSATWRSLLLNGPPGTSLYLEALARALAKHFGARVLVLGSEDFAVMRRRVFRRKQRQQVRERALRGAFLRLRGESEEVIAAYNARGHGRPLPPGSDALLCDVDKWYDTSCGNGAGGDNYDEEDEDDVDGADDADIGNGGYGYDHDYDYDYDYDYEDEDDEDDEDEDEDDDNSDEYNENSRSGSKNRTGYFGYDGCVDYDDYDDDDDDEGGDGDGDDDEDDDDGGEDDNNGGDRNENGNGSRNDDGCCCGGGSGSGSGGGDFDGYNDRRSSGSGGRNGSRALSLMSKFFIIQPTRPPQFSQHSSSSSSSSHGGHRNGSSISIGIGIGGSQRTLFKRDDRVEYVCQDDCLTLMGKSPTIGARGRVVLAFDEDEKTYGVEFDKAFPGGNDLGGMCRVGCGAFVAVSSLAPENLGLEIETSLVEALLAIAAQRKPLVVVIKDAIDLIVHSRVVSGTGRFERFLDLLERIDRAQLPTFFLGTSTADLTGIYGTHAFAAKAAASSSSGIISGLDIGGSATISTSRSATLPFSSLTGLLSGLGGSGGDGRISSLEPFLRSIFAATSASIFKHLGGGSSSSSIGDGGSHRHHSHQLQSRPQQKSIPSLFPRRVAIVKPTECHDLEKWTELVRQDTERARLAANAASFTRLLEHTRNTVVDGVSSASSSSPTASSAASRKALIEVLRAADPVFSSRKLRAADVGHVLAWAASHSIQTAAHTPCVLRAADFRHGATVLDSAQPNKAAARLAAVEPDNEYEQRILAEVVAPGDVRVSFDDIGALEDVKDTLRSTVMLPLQRPELFRRGNLAKPTRGILLFGPPGTGKTMLARAIATEGGAAFINVPISSLTSKLYGDDEKLVRALFTVATKAAPTVIFIDEVDGILGSRGSSSEHEMTRRIKNEFMSCWDGLRTSQTERVLVLAATNRPMDLDDAVLRRFGRRVLVDLPDAPNREKILRTLLKDESIAPSREAFDYAELARKTEGYSGSDLKNICVYAARQPIRELLAREKEESKRNGDDEKEEEEEPGCAAVATTTTTTAAAAAVSLRPLEMSDFVAALTEIGKSVGGPESASSVEELRRWNKIYGDGNGLEDTKSFAYFA